MTISWTDMDTTKNFFGRVWTNGETKTMCPGGFYQCQDAAFNDVEHWEFNAEFRMVARSNGSRFHNMTLWPYGVYTTPVFKQTKNNFGTATNSTGVLSRTGVDISGVPLTQAYISSEYFGSITFSGGVTISWTQNGSHWNPCSNT